MIPDRKKLCSKNSPPLGYETLWEKCNKYWNKAKDVLSKEGVGEEEFKEQSSITIKKKYRPPLKGPKKVVCYNPQLFREQGWCKVEGSTRTDAKWGFCSPSCAYLTTYDPVC